MGGTSPTEFCEIARKLNNPIIDKDKSRSLVVPLCEQGILLLSRYNDGIVGR